MHAPAQVIRSRGDCEDARMFLRGFKEALPQAWLAAEQRVEMERKGEVDLLEEEEREKLQNEDLDELLEVALDTELRGSFVPFREGDGDDPEAAVEGSDGSRRAYSLNPVPERLERDLQRYEEHRTAVLNRFRAGCAVGETTYENDRLNCLRFLGWLSKVYEPEEEEEEAEVPAMRVKAVYGNCELGSYIDSYCGWLRDERGCKMSTIANYIQVRAATYKRPLSVRSLFVPLSPLCCPACRAPSTSPNTCTPTCSQPGRSSRCRPAHRRRSTSSSTCGFRPRAPPGTTASTRADRRTGRAFSFIFCSGGS
jgi:hypothetical protein